MRRAALPALALLALACSTAPPRRPTSTPGPLIRVRLSVSDAPSATIVVPGAWRLLDEVTGAVLDSGKGLDRTDPVRGGRLPGPRRLVPADRRLLVSGARHEGDLLLLPVDGGLELVLETPLETYLLGVLAGELSPGFPSAALRAQAIASRSYALHRIGFTPPGRSWHVHDDTRSQVYAGLLPNGDAALRRAVADTRGMILTWRGRVLPAYFHSTCGGHTAPVDEALGAPLLPPLTGVPCDWCVKSRYYRWEARLPLSEAAELLDLPAAPTLARIAARGPDGRVLEVGFSGPPEAFRTGPDIRVRLGHSRIRSTLIFDIACRDGELLVHGGGWGHGAGLCQMGAAGLAARGASAGDILAHYYPGADLFRRW